MHCPSISPTTVASRTGRVTVARRVHHAFFSMFLAERGRLAALITMGRQV